MYTITKRNLVTALLLALSATSLAHSHTNQIQSNAGQAPASISTQKSDSDPAINSAATVELVFVLDTTGSMGGLLEGAKTKIWSIVNGIMQKRSKQGIKVKVGLVAYRDRGDTYLTKVTPLSENLDDVYTALMALRAEGGGDTPEDVRTAMKDALTQVGWSAPSKKTSQIMFLVGDAPPHDDYQDVPSTVSTTKLARQKGIIVNTIQCGDMHETVAPWQDIAQYGGGEYFMIAQNGGVQTIATPYDVELAALGDKIGGTYLAYGKKDERTLKQSKQAAIEMHVLAAAPAPARADRAVNKAINASAYDESDLVQKIETGSVNMSKLKEEDLPDDLQKLKPEERQTKIDQTIAERKSIRARILVLSKQRDQFLSEKVYKNEKDGFDIKVSAALEKQIK